MISTGLAVGRGVGKARKSIYQGKKLDIWITEWQNSKVPPIILKPENTAL